MDFMAWNWDDELKRYVDTITEPVDCIVLGRKLAKRLHSLLGYCGSKSE